ncbi:hypothetical protein KKG82_05265, partial [Patescibacteria group bacterium]|nr:hypothetical protein [Patescibacteria group bacterium]
KRFSLEIKTPQAGSFKDSLLKYAQKEFPEAVELLKKAEQETVDETVKREQRLAIIEHIAREKELSDLTAEELHLVGLEQIDEWSYRLPVTEHFMEKRLPEGYGYKGGAARSLLLRNLGIDPTSLPRDIDIVRLTEDEPEPGMDNELAQEYMPDDFKQGDGVEVLENIGEYLNTRDLTMNELYATDEYVVATDACLRDIIRGIVRQSDYEYKQYHDQIGPKMLAKMLRFYAEALSRGMELTLDDDAEQTIEEYGIRVFWLALNLDKAAEIGAKVAEQYVKELQQRKLIPANLEDVQDVADWLYQQMGPGNFYFRYAPASVYEAEDDWVE